MPFLVCLFALVFTQRMCPFNALFLALATAQPVLMDIAAIRSISILLMAVITARGSDQPAKGLYLTMSAMRWEHPC
jgi:sensor histidine kinase YesM